MMDFLAVYHDHFSKVRTSTTLLAITVRQRWFFFSYVIIWQPLLPTYVDCGQAGSRRLHVLPRVPLLRVPFPPPLRLPGGHLPLLHRLRVAAEARVGGGAGPGGGPQAEVLRLQGRRPGHGGGRHQAAVPGGTSAAAAAAATVKTGRSTASQQEVRRKARKRRKKNEVKLLLLLFFLVKPVVKQK